MAIAELYGCTAAPLPCRKSLDQPLWCSRDEEADVLFTFQHPPTVTDSELTDNIVVR
jgi:hypothetical protein